MADTNLEKVISEAAEEITGGKKKDEKSSESGEAEVTLTSEESEEENEEEAEEPEEDLSDDEKGESLRLYKALKDPKTAGPIIAALAQQAGLFNKNAPNTPTEEKKIVKGVKDLLAEGLGKEYGFLADRLAPAIEAVLAQERESADQKFAEIQQSRIEQEVVAMYNVLARETKGESRKLEAQMAKLSGEIPIGTMNVETYIKRLYTIAMGEKSKTPARQVAEKIRRNSNDATSRLHSTRGQQEAASLPKGKLNINKAVEWALESLTSGKKD